MSDSSNTPSGNIKSLTTAREEREKERAEQKASLNAQILDMVANAIDEGHEMALVIFDGTYLNIRANGTIPETVCLFELGRSMVLGGYGNRHHYETDES